MANGNGATSVTNDDFKRAFAALQPLVKQEWPNIDHTALESTGGDFDKVTELIATKLERTKIAVKKQLAELHAVATEVEHDEHDEHDEEPPRARSKATKFERILEKLDARTSEIARRVREEMVPKARATVKENIWVSLLIALGLGLILGFVIRMGSRRGD